jgi:hypothetical protein
MSDMHKQFVKIVQPTVFDDRRVWVWCCLRQGHKYSKAVHNNRYDDNDDQRNHEGQKGQVDDEAITAFILGKHLHETIVAL